MLEVYTDGACSGAPGIGGWAWATRDGRAAWGNDRLTTNQRMEMQAVFEAACAFDEPICVCSDSAYVINCFTEKWYLGWQQNGWRTRKKQAVSNRDIWEPLIEIVELRKITFRKVKGHSGEPMNELVDKLAVQAKKELLRAAR